MRHVILKALAATAALVLASVPAMPGPAAADQLASDQIAQAAVDLDFGSGRQGGSQYPVTVAIGQVLEALPEIGTVSLQPGGSVGNIVRVDTGKSDIAISMSQSLRDGRRGVAPFKSKTENVLNLFTLHPFYVVLIVPEESPIKAFKDIAGKRINVAPKGFSIVEVFDQLADMAGIKGKVDMGHLSVSEAVESFKDGHFDGLFYAASDRMAPFMNLAQTRNIRLVPLDKKYLEAFVKQDPSFYLTTWPKNSKVYKNLSNTAETLAYANIVVAKKSLDEKLAYAIVKAVAENFDKVRVGDTSLQDFDPKDMARDAGSPFHPGALRYYRERGWLK